MSQEPPYLADKVAVVTGVTAGLGKHVARVFTERGAKVVGVARRAELGEKLAAEIRASGGVFDFVAGDVSQEADCRRIVEAAMSRYGRIDALVNNAAISGAIVGIHEMSTEEWDRVHGLNLRGVFMLTREALAPMRAQRRGVILNIASVNGVIAVAQMSAYNASKAGLIHFTNSIAVESVDFGIRANCIIIGAVPSPMSFDTGAEIGRLTRGTDWSPSKDYRTRYGMRANPGAKVARALSLLCMDDADTITGAVIAIDGGVSAGLLGSQMNYLTCAQLLPQG